MIYNSIRAHWGKNAIFVHKCNFIKYDPGSQNRFISTKNTLTHLIMTIIVEFSDIFGWFGIVEVGVQSLLQFSDMSDQLSSIAYSDNFQVNLLIFSFILMKPMLILMIRRKNCINSQFTLSFGTFWKSPQKVELSSKILTYKKCSAMFHGVLSLVF